MRQIILDTETTGLSPTDGHRIIELGCVELIHRRLTGKSFHYYLKPDRKVDPGAIAVHGITDAFLTDKPRFTDIAEEFKDFIKGAELVIHNAPFDVGFIENEFLLINDNEWSKLEIHCSIIDTLKIARKKHPGQRNSLDALCKRYGVENQHREKHGALIDADILAKVYLAMTGGQNTLMLEESGLIFEGTAERTEAVVNEVEVALPVLNATAEELAAHEALLDALEKKQRVVSVWREEQI
ncbi:MAG: DNA polymerase III subunit epsilon [Candidatus Berkiellales bacterium]